MLVVLQAQLRLFRQDWVASGKLEAMCGNMDGPCQVHSRCPAAVGDGRLMREVAVHVMALMGAYSKLSSAF